MKKVTAPVVERAPLKPTELTFSELLSGFKALRGAASGDVEVKRFEALVKAADALPIQAGPFEPSYLAARSEAAKRLGLQGYDKPNLLEKLFGAKSKLTGALPLPPGEVAFNPKTTKPGGTNQVLTAALSSVAYEESRFNYDTSKPYGPLHDHVKALGFTEQSLTDGVTRIAGPEVGGANALPGGARVLVASRPGVTALAFRGTTVNYDIMKDLKFSLADGARYGGGRVHQGFHESLESIWPEVSAGIKAARAKNPNEPIVFTGHSLGGALAVLALARAKQEGLLDSPPYRGKGSVAVLDTYGQPRVGDAAFAKAFQQSVGDIPYHRYVYRNDPVPRLPPTGMGYSDLASAQTVFTDDAGKSHRVANDDPRLNTLEQKVNAATVPEILATAAAQVPDHTQINYLVTARRGE